MTPRNQHGFTLVELAIVLMIIGLLIGGVLRGQELLDNSRVASTIQQVTAYAGAKTTFMNAYNALPGDMSNAMTRLPGCTTDAACTNGDGNNILGTVVTGTPAQPWTAITPAINSENTQFWKHLALTHLISGVTPSSTTPEWGASHPTAKIGGGFFARYSNMPATNGYGTHTGHLLVLRNRIDGQFACGGGTVNDTGACVITPLRAAQIDKKMDDGIATTGDVIAVSANWTNGCGVRNSGKNGPTGYGVTDKAKACDMMFKMP